MLKKTNLKIAGITNLCHLIIFCSGDRTRKRLLAIATPTRADPWTMTPPPNQHRSEDLSYIHPSPVNLIHWLPCRSEQWCLSVHLIVSAP